MTGSPSCPPAGDPDAIAKFLIQRAHNSDGLPEIGIGLTFLMIGGLSYAQALLPHESIAFKSAVFALALLIPALSIGLPAGVTRVRQRYFIGRVGYVRHRPAGRKTIVVGMALAILAGLVMLVVVTRHSLPDRWVLAGTGLFGGALAAFAGRLPRFLVAGVLMAAAGLLIAFSGVSLLTGFALLFGFQGLLALISGGVVLLRLIRQPAGPGE